MEKKSLDLNTFTKAELETKSRIEKEIVEILKNGLTTETIRFWEENEILPNDEIKKKYPSTISSKINLETTKKSKKIKALLGKDSQFSTNFCMAKILLGLDLSTQAHLTSWSKQFFSIISNYFKNSDLYTLRSLRFEFLPEKNNSEFIIPYIKLEHIEISKTPKSPIIDLHEYIKSKTIDFEDVGKLIQDFQKFAK